jgi:hypothetical protein
MLDGTTKLRIPFQSALIEASSRSIKNYLTHICILEIRRSKNRPNRSDELWTCTSRHKLTLDSARSALWMRTPCPIVLAVEIDGPSQHKGYTRTLYSFLMTTVTNHEVPVPGDFPERTALT